MPILRILKNVCSIYGAGILFCITMEAGVGTLFQSAGIKRTICYESEKGYPFRFSPINKKGEYPLNFKNGIALGLNTGIYWPMFLVYSDKYNIIVTT